MLNVTNNLLKHFSICMSPSPKKSLSDNVNKPSKLRKLILKTSFDAIVVGGVVFFSTLASMGYSDMYENARIALTSSVIASGLSFFTELKKNQDEIL